MLAEETFSFFHSLYSLEVCQIDFTATNNLDLVPDVQIKPLDDGQKLASWTSDAAAGLHIGFLDNLYWTQVELESLRAFQVSQPTHKAWLRSLRLSVSANISIDCSCSGFGNLPNQCQTLLQEKKQLHVPVLLCLINMTVSLLCLYITLWCKSAS